MVFPTWNSKHPDNQVIIPSCSGLERTSPALPDNLWLYLLVQAFRKWSSLQRLGENLSKTKDKKLLSKISQTYDNSICNKTVLPIIHVYTFRAFWGSKKSNCWIQMFFTFYQMLYLRQIISPFLASVLTSAKWW